MSKRALITGITGQDGSYLAKSLLGKGYKVFGGHRGSTSQKHWRLDEMGITEDIEFVKLDLMDQKSISRAIENTEPDEVYNLAAQFIGTLSFEQPELATLVDGLGVLKLLESIRQVNQSIKFYQASTSDLYGKAQEAPQSEQTKFFPRSPYAVAKLYAHHITINYREAYNMFACCGILFNHESPMRGEIYVTRKITKGIALWLREGKPIVLGNLEAQRDWGHAEDFVEGMQLILNSDQPQEYVLATGKTNTVKQFVDKTLTYLSIPGYWKGDECFDKRNNKLIVTTDKAYLRSAEVNLLVGDSTKIKTELGWNHKYDIDSLIADMGEADLRRYSKKAIKSTN